MLLDLRKKTSFKKIEISELELQKIISENFKIIFPELTLIEEEYRLSGDVRAFGISGRIDLLALNKDKSRLIIFELKLSNSRNILIQALDYSDFVEDNFELIISRLKSISNEEKDFLLEKRLTPNIILIAEKFTHPTIRRTQSLSNRVKLFSFEMFSNEMIQITELTKKKKIVYTKETNHFEFLKENIIKLIRDIIENEIIDEELFLIEKKILTVNSTILHNAYKEYFKKSNIRTIGKTSFFNILKEKDEYIQNLKTKRFKNNNTSVIEIKYEK